MSHWIDAQGSIANAESREIAKLDTLRASKMLAAWVDQGLLVALPGRGKRNTAYTKPARPPEQASLLSMGQITNCQRSINSIKTKT